MNKIFRFKSRQKMVFLAVSVLLLNIAETSARDPKTDKLLTERTPSSTVLSDRPIVEYAAHSQGSMVLMIGNNGTFGCEGTSQEDVLTGEYFESCVYPKNSDLVYLWVAALWVGAIKGRDTLVSTGTEDFYCAYEFWPDLPGLGGFKFKSIDAASPHYAEDAYSEQDIICEYTDTIRDPGLTDPGSCEPRVHIPLNIKATQRSMAWSYDYADDFVLFDYQIENIGYESLEDVYMGIWIDGDVWHTINQDAEHWTDDLVGFYRHYPAPEGCGFIDTIDIAYHTDNDGDPTDGVWDDRSPRSAIGVRVVRTPSDSLAYSYNWWIIDYGDPRRDFGPRQSGTPEDPFRDFGVRLGTPIGDENKHYILRHDEFDYDLLYVAIDHSDSGRGWLPPPENATNYADGYDVRNLLSFGPFNIDPGERLPISFAWIGGDGVHVNPGDFSTFNPYNPSSFYNRLDFSTLAVNSRWASWIYDNPGVDTDGDGWAGHVRVCCGDTAGYYLTNIADTLTIPDFNSSSCNIKWYKGDNVPDFRGASPPPPPDIRLEPQVGRLVVHFNGLASETAADRFSGIPDFEGYRVYTSRDDRLTSFSLYGSYDREDYNKFVYLSDRGEYRLLDIPFTREQLQELYGDPAGITNFDPTLFGQTNPYVHPDFPDSVFYFVSQDFNQSEFGVTTPIRKSYPDEPYPSTLDPTQAPEDELTDDGYLKYFEYEITIDGLLSTIPYYISVTAFDFGSPEIGLAALESSILNSTLVGYPLTSADSVEAQNLNVFVYPNPYRGDADYEGQGFENRDGTESADRMRRIHFANLPNVCKIYIYSIDGDLVREIDHYYPDGGPEAMHETWDLITRNTQAAVTGLYYWVVESEDRTQIGKLVIIE
ncbi:MAG: hypothetical protein JSV52_05310 [Candidatus Zixiibacteriota bacterium]|nr:MAG: hypothetical protein JSV52_05310 [candidate division Zixibacteria bacterium]